MSADHKSSLSIKTVSGKGIDSYLNDLALLRIEIFREFPYLYDGSARYEKKYLSTYVNSDDSIAVFVFDDDQLVGASTALPLADESEEFKKPFLSQGIDPKTVFYCGESILKKNYRGKGIYSVFMNKREAHAKRLGRFDLICFCAVSREKNHPLKPDDFIPLDEIWNKYGYKKEPNLKTEYFWKDVNKNEETAKEMIFWTKNL
jgi:GNAT superfamily N-acetyltransferase